MSVYSYLGLKQCGQMGCKFMSHMIGVIFICMVLCHLSFLVGDRLHLDVTGHQVLWLPVRPGGPGGPSESSEGSWELPG